MTRTCLTILNGFMYASRAVLHAVFMIDFVFHFFKPTYRIVAVEKVALL